jgi:hypothetical protein
MALGRGVVEAWTRHTLQRARRLGYRAMRFNLVIGTDGPAIRLGGRW